MILLTARPASTTTSMLGEGPVWDEARGCLLWVDIPAAAVHEGRLEGDQVVTTRTHRLADVTDTVGAVAPATDGRLLVAGHRSLIVLDRETGRCDTLQAIGSEVRSRLNDGACDPAGRFLVGTLALDDRTGNESLLRLEDDGVVTVVDAALTLANGLAWSPDGRLLYSVDSVPGVVWARTGPRHALVRVADGLPDGLCVDADGGLWLAVWGAGQVRRFSPDGELTAVVEVPAPHTTSAAFIGADRSTLLITTARSELSAAELARYPDSGRNFVVDVGVPGLPTTPWNGESRRFTPLRAASDDPSRDPSCSTPDRPVT